MFKKFEILLSNDFHFQLLQKNYLFKLEKYHYERIDLIHKLSFKENFSPTYLQLFAKQLNKKEFKYQSLVSPVHISVNHSGLVLNHIFDFQKQAIFNDFLYRFNQHFNFSIESLDSGLWAAYFDHPFAIFTTSHSVDAYLQKNINQIHNDAFLNEVQMFIHHDPIYEQTKKEFGFSLNSLWFWGAFIEDDYLDIYKKQNYKFKNLIQKTYGKHIYFDALAKSFSVANIQQLDLEIKNNQFKSNNLLLCQKEHFSLVKQILDKYKKRVNLYFRKNKAQIR